MGMSLGSAAAAASYAAGTKSGDAWRSNAERARREPCKAAGVAEAESARGSAAAFRRAYTQTGTVGY